MVWTSNIRSRSRTTGRNVGGRLGWALKQGESVAGNGCATGCWVRRRVFRAQVAGMVRVIDRVEVSLRWRAEDAPPALAAPRTRSGVPGGKHPLAPEAGQRVRNELGSPLAPQAGRLAFGPLSERADQWPSGTQPLQKRRAVLPDWHSDMHHAGDAQAVTAAGPAACPRLGAKYAASSGSGMIGVWPALRAGQTPVVPLAEQAGYLHAISRGSGVLVCGSRTCRRGAGPSAVLRSAAAGCWTVRRVATRRASRAMSGSRAT